MRETHPPAHADFLRVYLEAFSRLDGMFSPDAAILFMAYAEAAARAGIAGDVLEIGVHHGKSAIAVAALRGPSARFVAIDLFEERQNENISRSGGGNRDRFERNMAAFHGDLSFVEVRVCASTSLQPEDLSANFSFCHVDGGHSAAETYHDLWLTSHVLLDGGLLALDDYFNPSFPGVCEGAVRFMLDHESALTPLAIGFNKVVFQKRPAKGDLNAHISSAFPHLPAKTVTFWDRPVRHFVGSATRGVDLERSRPHQLAQRDVSLSALIEPLQQSVTSQVGQTFAIPVRVVNHSDLPFSASEDAPFGLSYHLRDQNGQMLMHDNIRSYFWQAIGSGQERVVELSVVAPDLPGRFQIEIDVIWEGIKWFGSTGGTTSLVDLVVTPDA